MRIISGNYKGRRLMAPKKLPVRPTTDFAKEALFNILRNRVAFEKITVLDLFSGTGNISYEFASRGVKNITAVDANMGCIKYIQKISEAFSFPIKIIKADVEKYLSSANTPFDLIFADPPYDFTMAQLQKIIETVFENNLLSEDGTLILEHSKHHDLSDLPHFVEVRKYGGSAFGFFKTNPDSEGK